MHAHRWAEWSITFAGSAGSVVVAYTPSYVPAGSGTVTVQTARGESRICATEANGYDAQWRHLHAMATHAAPALHGPRAALDDLDFATRIAAQAARKAQEILA